MRAALFLSAALVALVAPAAFADPVINLPPPGSHSFVALYETGAPLGVCLHVQCQIASAASVNTSMAPVTFVGSDPNRSITGFGSTSGAAMHAFIRATTFAEIDTAFEDTYTVHGGAGSFSIAVTMNVDSIAGRVSLGPGTIGIDTITGVIGTFDIDPLSTEIPIVHPFDATSQVQAHVSLGGADPLTAPLNLSVSYTRIVNPGDVFDLGYELEAGAFGVVDASNTATVNFALPDGVYLTDAYGNTFGTPPSVPEPAAWALMTAGFGLTGATLRVRKARASLST